MRLVVLLIGLVSALLLGGCASSYPPKDTATYSALIAPYKLDSGDRLRIVVFGQTDLSNTYLIDQAGYISMPLIGAIDVNGRTTAQLERAIEARLRAGYLREPRVSVEVDAYRPFFVLGEVTNSGQFPFVNGMTVQTAVAIAGGFTPRGQRNFAEVTRMMDGQLVTGTVPITYAVRPGDTIVIKERWF